MTFPSVAAPSVLTQSNIQYWINPVFDFLSPRWHFENAFLWRSHRWKLLWGQRLLGGKGFRFFPPSVEILRWKPHYYWNTTHIPSLFLGVWTELHSHLTNDSAVCFNSPKMYLDACQHARENIFGNLFANMKCVCTENILIFQQNLTGTTYLGGGNASRRGVNLYANFGVDKDCKQQGKMVLKGGSLYHLQE